MKQAYGEMGISILSGAFTTFGSGVFLFAGKVTVFQKFAVLITCTVAFSFIVANLFFGAIMHSIGPENGVGDLKNVFNGCKNKK